MDDGRLVPPNLDDRKWQDLVDEIKTLIPQYAPQWTDHNASDLGITLVELFAWLFEGMLYRLNRVPEKNYIEFLNLLGITRDPATPAKTNVTFTVTNVPTTIVPKGTKIATPHTPTEEPIVFETDEELTALPINLTHMLYATKATSQYVNFSEVLVSGPLLKSNILIPAGSADGVFLGFDQPSIENIRVAFELHKAAEENNILLLWGYSRGAVLPDSWPLIDYSYSWDLNPSDQTKAFTQSGSLNIGVPADWQAQSPSDWASFVQPASPSDDITDSRYWIVIWVANIASSPIELVLQQIRFNSISASNALTVNVPRTDAGSELLGISNGKSFQHFALKNPPLYKQPESRDPYDHLIVEVREPIGGGGLGPWVTWRCVEDFPPAITSPDNQVYKCNPVTGEITFGNQDSVTGVGNGKIPPQGSEIRALTYRYVVGGIKGNVPAHTIKVIREVPPPGVPGAIIKVINPGPAIGGSDQEPIEDTKRRAPEVLKNRDRAVSIKDYEYQAREPSTDIKKVRALAPRLHEAGVAECGVNYTAGTPWRFGDLDRSPGRVNVIVVPDAPEPLGHSSPEPQPKPEEDLLVEVANYLEQRRPATTHILVTGPRYLPIRVIVTVKIWQSAIDAGLIGDPNIGDTLLRQSYCESVVQKLRRFLHPTRGNESGQGWEIGECIYQNQVFNAVQPPAEIGFIESISLAVARPECTLPLRPPGYKAYDSGAWIQVADYELICDGVQAVCDDMPNSDIKVELA